MSTIAGLAAAVAIVQAASATASSAASAAGLTALATAATSAGAAAGALASGVAGAAAAAGPAAPFAAAAIYLVTTWRRIAKGAENLEACRERAAGLILGASLRGGAFPIVRLASSETASDPACWHRGKKTKDKLDGRVSFRIPTTVRREDVIPRSSDGAIRSWLGRGRDHADQVVILPWLGPFALQERDTITRGTLTNYAPAASLAALAYTEQLLVERPPWVRKAAAEMLARLYASGLPSRSRDDWTEELLTLLRAYLGVP